MLLIDVGNSRIKSALCTDAGLQPLAVQIHPGQEIESVLAGSYGHLQPQPVYIACVVDALRPLMQKWFEQNWKLCPVFVSSAAEFAGVSNAYAQPDTLGVDRWLAMIAAFSFYQQAVCVIDCGTAVTVDIIDNGGVHHGGLIMPGLRMMRSALTANTSKLKASGGIVSGLARNTADAVESGSVQLLVAGLECLCQRYARQFTGLKIVITGGDADWVMRASSISAEYRQHLVLEGLSMVAGRTC